VSAKGFYERVKRGILQYCVAYPVVGITAAVLTAMGRYEEGVLR
jgi:hypothetical protein